MSFSKIVAYLIFLFVCFSTSLHAGEYEHKAAYEEAQKLIDEYSGNTSLLKKAFKLLEKIALVNPNSKYVLVGYGRLSYKSGYISGDKYHKDSLKRAKAYFEKAVLVDPNFFDAYLYGHHLYLISKDYEKAKYMANRAAELSPNSAKVDVLFGRLAEHQKHYKTAIKHAKSAIEKRPDDKTLVDTYSLLKRSYKKLKKYDHAENAYINIINIEPNSAWARANYSAFLRVYREDYDKAIEQAIIALELMDFGMGHSTLAKASYAKGVQLYWNNEQYKEAIEYFLLTVEHNPYHADAWYGLGISYYRIGHKYRNKPEILKAKEYLERAVQIEPNHQDANALLINARKLLHWIDNN